MIIIMFLQQNI